MRLLHLGNVVIATSTAATAGGGFNVMATAVRQDLPTLYAGFVVTLTADELPEPNADDLVYLSGYSLLHDSNRAALIPWLAQLSDDVEVFFDPGPLVAELPECALEAVLARVDWWSSNAAEATLLTGLDDPGDAARAVRAVDLNGAGDAGPI